MTRQELSVALGLLFAGAASGYWFAPGDGQPATIVQDTPSPTAPQLSATEATKVTAAATKAGASGDLTCAKRQPANKPAGVFCTDGGTAGWWLTAAQQSAFISAVRERYPEATADSVVLVSLGEGGLYDRIVAQK